MGTETSKYHQEKKENSTSLVVASEKEYSPNHIVVSPAAFSIWGSGAQCLPGRRVGEVTKFIVK